MKLNLKLPFFTLMIMTWGTSLLIIKSSNSYAHEYELFKHGEFAPHYEKIIELIKDGQIQEGEQLRFSKRTFNFKKLLGHGGTTLIISIGQNRALRIPLTAELGSDLDLGVQGRVDRDYLKDYYTTHEGLNERGIPVIKLYDNDTRSSSNAFGELEYVMVEEIQPVMTLSAFLKSKPKADEAGALYLGLIDLIAKSYKQISIGDLHGDNLVWDGTKWVVLDFTDGGKSFFFGNDVHENPDLTRHILSSFPLPAEWNEKFRSITKKLRINYYEFLKADYDCKNIDRIKWAAKREREIQERQAATTSNPLKNLVEGLISLWPTFN